MNPAQGRLEEKLSSASEGGLSGIFSVCWGCAARSGRLKRRGDVLGRSLPGRSISGICAFRFLWSLTHSDSVF